MPSIDQQAKRDVLEYLKQQLEAILIDKKRLEDLIKRVEGEANYEENT
jgi:CBS-domain-containing membrane protein